VTWHGDDFDASLDRRIEAYQAATQAVRAQRKTLTLDEAIKAVVDTFTTRGLPAPDPSDARALARASLDRWWVWKHPVTAHREGWFSKGD
jgi:hypothetical protein